MRNPIDKLTSRWRRKKERETVAPVKVPSQEELLAEAMGLGNLLRMPKRDRAKRPSQIKRWREHGANPQFSKRRRLANKIRRIDRMQRHPSRLPHGRQSRPGPRRRARKGMGGQTS